MPGDLAQNGASSFLLSCRSMTIMIWPKVGVLIKPPAGVDGMEERRKEAMKEARKTGRKEGRKEGREEEMRWVCGCACTARSSKNNREQPWKAAHSTKQKEKDP